MVWNTRLNHYGWKTYLGDIYGTDEVPAYAATARQSDYSNLPPAYTSVCTGEPFYCETLAFVENLRAAGVEVGLDVYEGLYHAFDMLQLLFVYSSASSISAFSSFTPGTFFLQSSLDTPAYSSPIPLMIFIISTRTSLGESTSI